MIPLVRGSPWRNDQNLIEPVLQERKSGVFKLVSNLSGSVWSFCHCMVFYEHSFIHEELNSSFRYSHAPGSLSVSFT